MSLQWQSESTVLPVYTLELCYLVCRNMCFCMLAVMVHTPTATGYQLYISDLEQALQHATGQQRQKHTQLYSSNACDNLGRLRAGAQSLGIGMAGITVELCFRLCYEAVSGLLFLGSISTDIRWLYVAATIVTPCLTRKVRPQHIAVIHSNHVLERTYAVCPVASCCAALALFTNLYLDACWKLRGRWQRHDWLAYKPELPYNCAQPCISLQVARCSMD
jgi:hypothetical protein